MSQRIRKLFSGEWPALIAFDLDGTLVDSAPDLTLAIDTMLQQLGRAPAGESKIRQWIGNGAQMLVRRALADSDAPEKVAQISDALQADALARFRVEYHHVNGQQSQLYKGLPELFTVWADKGSKLVIVTNKPKQFADPLLQALGVIDHFALVVGGECLPQRKPHPLPLLHTADVLGIPAAHTLMVGDSRHDVSAARAAAMPVICRRDGYNHGEPIELSEPDDVFDCYTELL